MNSVFTQPPQKISLWLQMRTINHELMTESRWGWGFNYGDGGHFIVLLIDNVGGRNETSRVPLEIFIQLLGLKRPAQVLAE